VAVGIRQSILTRDPDWQNASWIGPNEEPRSARGLGMETIMGTNKTDTLSGQ